MRRGSDRLNRAALTLIGLVLLGAGVYGLARGYEAFGAAPAEDPILLDSVQDTVSRTEGWFWWVALLASVVVAWLGLRWLLAQFGSPRIAHVDLTRDDSRGTTRLRPEGASDALEGDIQGYPGVQSAAARLVDDGPRPEVAVRVDVHEDADVGAVRARMDEHAFPRLCRALEVGGVEARVLVRLVDRSERVVR